MHKIELEPAYILHSRPYRETSLLLEIFTSKLGRFSAIAKGVRGVRRPKSSSRALLQPFVPLLVSCVGRGELLILKHFEPVNSPHLLLGRRLISGFYLNELLMRLLQRFDAHEALFHAYVTTLQALAQESEEIKEGKNSCEQIILRLFEKALLKAIGYELPLTIEAEGQKPVLPEAWYLFDPERGPLITHISNPNSDISSRKPSLNLKIYAGKSLLALANETIEDPEVQRDAKFLMREALKLHLGSKPLETRKLL